MPEGPSIVILRDALYLFKGYQILEVEGNSKIGQTRLLNQRVLDFKS